MRSIALAFMAMSAGSTAYAADCASAYTTDGLIGDLSAVEGALRQFDDAAATAAGEKLRSGLGCLDEVLPALIAARAYRAVGAGLYSGGDPDAANKWFSTSLELEPTWSYGLQDLPEGHPLRLDFDNLRNSMAGGDPVDVAGKSFGEGSHYLDGRKLSKPRARLDRFHLFQTDNGGVSTHIIEGNAFPADVLTGAVVADTKQEKDPKQPKGNKEPTAKQLAKAEAQRQKQAEKAAKKADSNVKTTVSADGKVYYKRQRPKEKTPLMIAGGVIMAGAAGLYWASTRTAKDMRDITTAADVNDGAIPEGRLNLCAAGAEVGENGCLADPEDVVRKKAGITNRLAVASLAVFAVGAGTTTWGIILDGGTAMPAVKIRF